jgi:hypothetical protein
MPLTYTIHTLSMEYLRSIYTLSPFYIFSPTRVRILTHLIEVMGQWLRVPQPPF